MSAAPLAGLAAVLGVAALWELLAAVEALAVTRAVGRLLAPLRGGAAAGRAPSAPERRRLAVVGAAVLLAGGWLVLGPVGAIACAAGGPGVVRLLLGRRARRHRAELERAAPLVARAIADALGAGHAVTGALVEAGRGIGGAAAAELAAVAAALRVGEPVETVLADLRARAGSRAYDTLVAAILLQRDAGGDLALLLRELASAQEEAIRLADDARAATAQARFTGVVVTVLPAGAAGLAELARPGALAALLGVPLAAWLAGFAVMLQAGALLAIRRIARVTG